MEDINQFPERQTESETADYISHGVQNNRSPLLRQGALNYLAPIASTLSSLVLVPLMLVRLGAQAYGFWIFVLAMPAFASGVDSALSLSVTRETALHSDGISIADGSTRSFLSACCGVYCAIGLFCGLLVVLAGAAILPGLHLSSTLQAAAPTVFLAVAFAFAAGRTVTFANAVLAGFQRFGTINAISIAALSLRFLGFGLLLLRHGTLSQIAIWYTVVALFECSFALAIVHRVGAFSANRSVLQWGRLSHVVEFGLSSFLTTELFNFLSFSPPLLASMLTGGTGATTVLYAGQRPCFIVSEFSWRGAEVLFSASAAEEKRRGPESYTDLMAFGTTSLLAVAMPLCIGLFVLAPVLSAVWLSAAGPGVATVMRLTSIGIIADAVWVGPLHVLWGRGLANRVLAITSCVAASALLLNLLLIPKFGPSGSATSFLVSTWIGAIITMIAATSGTGSSWIRTLGDSFSKISVPAISLTASTWAVSILFHNSPKLLLLIAILAGGTVYVGLFFALELFRRNSRHA